MKKPNVRLGALLPIAGLVTLLVATTLGALYGLPLAVLSLATAALGLVLALLWSSVSSLASDSELSLDEALSYGAPSNEEEQKAAVLRALKDLEFERSVGKISEDDYREFSARYRAEARRLVKQVDESLAEAQKLAEALADERIEKALGESSTTASEPEEPEVDEGAEPAAAAEKPPVSTTSCAACGTENDADARFCKRCGKALAEEEIAVGEEKVS